MTAASPPFPGKRMPRYLAVTLPWLATDRLRRARQGRWWRSSGPPETGEPLVTVASVAGARRLDAVCEAANARGLKPGLGLAEATARFPGLDAVASDVEADRGLLEDVADWCDRYTPLVGLDAPCGLILDVTGCAHLFGGERAMMDDLLVRLAAQGFGVCAALASRPGTALARLGDPALSAGEGVAIAPGDEIDAVAPLPVSALRLPPDRAAMLNRLGLKTIRSLLDLPRAGLARRFGKALLVRLDEATGRADRPITPRRPVPDLSAERRLFEPIARTEDVERLLAMLAERLEGDLARRGRGARRLELALFRVDGMVERLGVGAARPVRAPAAVSRLFAERIKGLGEGFDAGYGYDCVKLSVLAAEDMVERQTDLAGEAARADALGGLVDRLGARLGEGCVLAVEPGDSHRPERAAAWRPVHVGVARTGTGAGSGAPRLSPGSSMPLAGSGERPLRLLARPEPITASFAMPDGPPVHFRWRRALYRVSRAEGPERIAGEWWRAGPAADPVEAGEAVRDYFRIEDTDGRRFWLFRQPQGPFAPRAPLLWPPEANENALGADAGDDMDGAAADPEWVGEDGRPFWYLHGLFA